MDEKHQIAAISNLLDDLMKKFGISQEQFEYTFVEEKRTLGAEWLKLGDSMGMRLEGFLGENQSANGVVDLDLERDLKMTDEVGHLALNPEGKRYAVYFEFDVLTPEISDFFEALRKNLQGDAVLDIKGDDSPDVSSLKANDLRAIQRTLMRVSNSMSARNSNLER